VTRLLDYFATHPNATIRYHRSGTVLYFHTDASYLSERKARSRLGELFFLSSMPADHQRQPLPTDPAPPMNGAVKTNSTIMNSVLASAAEAENGAMFYNCLDAKMRSQSASPSKKWDTHNRPPTSEETTVRQLALPMTRLKYDDPKPST
jgi:hypothetical protein